MQLIICFLTRFSSRLPSHSLLLERSNRRAFKVLREIKQRRAKPVCTAVKSGDGLFPFQMGSAGHCRF